MNVSRSKTTSSILSTLDAQLAELATKKAETKTTLDAHQRALTEVLRDVHEKNRDGKPSKRATLVPDDAMDVDEARQSTSESKGKKMMK